MGVVLNYRAGFHVAYAGIPVTTWFNIATNFGQLVLLDEV